MKLRRLDFAGGYTATPQTDRRGSVASPTFNIYTVNLRVWWFSENFMSIDNWRCRPIWYLDIRLNQLWTDCQAIAKWLTYRLCLIGLCVSFRVGPNVAVIVCVFRFFLRLFSLSFIMLCCPFRANKDGHIFIGLNPSSYSPQRTSVTAHVKSKQSITQYKNQRENKLATDYYNAVHILIWDP